MTIKVEPVLQSRDIVGRRISTFLCRYPAFFHQDVMTHRVFSRCAASTRAIPIRRMIRNILSDMAMPIHWGKNQSGMQAKHELTGVARQVVKAVWYMAGVIACMLAYIMHLCGAHKQVANMILWPFMHMEVVITSSEWYNFLILRDHEDARPEIQELARLIRYHLENGRCHTLLPGGWHIPFANDKVTLPYSVTPLGIVGNGELLDAVRIGVACAASASYGTVDGAAMTLERAGRIFSKLVESEPLHASPLEHVVQSDPYLSLTIAHANTPGFIQYRHVWLKPSFNP